MENQLPPGQVPPPLPAAQPPIFVTTNPPRRGGGGWMILSLSLLLILGVFVASRMVRFMAPMGARSTGSESGRHFEEIVVENPEVDAKIAIVPVQGMISR